MLQEILWQFPDLMQKIREFSMLFWIVALLLLFVIPHPAVLGAFHKAEEKYVKWARNRKGLFTRVLPALIMVQLALTAVYVWVDMESKATFNIKDKVVIIEIDDFWNLDDPSFKTYGYSLERDQEVLGVIERHGYAATLGVSPNIYIERNSEILPLSADNGSVAYLREKMRMGHEIAMHGYAHCRNPAECSNYEENYLNILRGKKELGDLFGEEIITYLPPGNSWEPDQYANVVKAGFRVIANTHVWEPNWDGDVLITERGYDVVGSWDWYHMQFEHHSYEEWVADYEEQTSFIIQLHCNTFDSPEKLEDLDRFLTYLEEDGAKVVTYREAYEILKEQEQ